MTTAAAAADNDDDATAAVAAAGPVVAERLAAVMLAVGDRLGRLLREADARGGSLGSNELAELRQLRTALVRHARAGTASLAVTNAHGHGGGTGSGAAPARELTTAI